MTCDWQFDRNWLEAGRDRGRRAGHERSSPDRIDTGHGRWLRRHRRSGTRWPPNWWPLTSARRRTPSVRSPVQSRMTKFCRGFFRRSASVSKKGVSCRGRLTLLSWGAGMQAAKLRLPAAPMGARTLLLTMDRDRVAQMSCNPAIGGIAKGHLVKEIDALGGEMAVNTDRAGIRFRFINTSKGPAVALFAHSAIRRCIARRCVGHWRAVRAHHRPRHGGSVAAEGTHDLGCGDRLWRASGRPSGHR